MTVAFADILLGSPSIHVAVASVVAYRESVRAFLGVVRYPTCDEPWRHYGENKKSALKSTDCLTPLYKMCRAGGSLETCKGLSRKGERR